MVLVLFTGIHAKQQLGLRYFSAAVLKSFVPDHGDLITIRRPSSVEGEYGYHGGLVALRTAYRIESKGKPGPFGIPVLRRNVPAVELLMNDR